MTDPMLRDIVDASSVGVHRGRLDVLLERVRQDVEHGPLPSAQIAVAKDGRAVAFATYGDTTPATRYITQSAGRPLLAACVWKLMSDGLLDVDQRVATVIPEFGANGKDAVTYRQVLTHTGGFPMAPIRYPAIRDRAQRLQAMARWRLTFEPGTAMEYHLTSAAWVIADTVEALTGLPLPDYLRTVISEPLGLDLELGVAPERQADTVAPIVAIGDVPDDWEPDPWGPWFFRDPEVLAAGEPSHTICSTALDTVLLFQAMYHTDLFDPDVIAFADEHGGRDADRHGPRTRARGEGPVREHRGTADRLALDLGSRRRAELAHLARPRGRPVGGLLHQRLPGDRLRRRAFRAEPQHGHQHLGGRRARRLTGRAHRVAALLRCKTPGAPDEPEERP